MTKKKCPFCNPKEFSGRLIFETKSFSVVATLGQVVEGYVLIVPKRHAACLGALTYEETREYQWVHAKMREAIGEVYKTFPIAFEHGVVGQTVSHAHMHMAPVPKDIGFLETIMNEYRFTIDDSLSELSRIYKREGQYLFYETGNDYRFVFRTAGPDVGEPPSQYLRLLFAQAVGRPRRGNWRNMDPRLDWRLIKKTVRKLTAALRD